ncbi:MAG: PKD domain-containing protein [Woeseiaceae bacterium]|nr:PKD domain-containing protein [Woeseiaceae bacterium]
MTTISTASRALSLSLALCLFSFASHAGTGCDTIFKTIYPNSTTDDGGSCQTCHESAGGGNNFNHYGVDLLANGASGSGFNCTNTDFAAALVAVEGFDSDGEGNSNIVEIEAGTQPGWCDTTLSPACANSGGTPPNTTLDPAPANGIPVAHPGGPYTGEAGVTLIQFDGSGSTDPDNDLLTYAWDFGDGSTGSGVMPSHTYGSAGSFQVSLVVNDGINDSPEATTTATITEPIVNLAPVADPGGPYSGQPGVAVQFDGSGSSDPNGDALSYAWDFGDGAMGDGIMPTHSYAAAGTYTVSLVVNDGEFDSAPDETTVEVTDPADPSDGQQLYDTYCLSCHGDPWTAPAVDDTLAGLRRVAGARSCNIDGSIYGTSVFPNGVVEMQFLQGLTEAEVDAMAEYLNSQETTGEQRYITTCAGCHGNNGAGGRTGEDVHGESAHETWEAIDEEEEMRYLSCMPESDIDAISDFLFTFDDDYDDDGIEDDDDHDDDNDGIDDDADNDDDNDGMSDEEEHEDGTDPRDHDSDDDGRSDGEEDEDGTDPLDHDSDDDGLDDGEEHEHGTDPNDEDSDDDGNSDGDEVKKLGTNPLVADNVASDSQSGGGGSIGLVWLLSLLLLNVAKTRRY